MTLTINEMKELFNLSIDCLKKANSSHPAIEQEEKQLKGLKVSDALIWEGTDTYTNRIRVAYKEGKFFSSALVNTPYGMNWEKWRLFKEPVLVGCKFKWGFSELDFYGKNNRLRLPKL